MNLELLNNNLDNFINNESEINQLIDFIQTSNNYIFIHGICKSSKHLLVKFILTKYNIKYNYILASNIPNKKNINNFINNYLKTQNIYNLLYNNNNQSAIIIDNLELTIPAHKYFYIYISKYIKKYNKLLILISNTNYFKYYNNIKDIYEEIHFNIDTNNTKTDCLHQNNLFNITTKLLYDYVSYSHLVNEYNNNKYLIPLLLHENYLNYLKKSNIKQSDLKQIISIIMKSYINYDYLDNYMFANQYWDLQKISGLIPCITISLHINDNTILYNKFIYNNIIYTKFLNKVSLISINRKIILKLMIKFNIFNIIKILRICNLIDDSSEFSEDMIKHHNINNKNNDSIIKLNN